MNTGRTTAIFFVAPTLLLLLALNLFPLGYSVWMSFTNARIGGAAWDWVGTANYAAVFDRPAYSASIWTTAVFVFFAVLIELVLGFILALSLRKTFAGKSVVLMILLVPMMLSPAVVGLFWHQLLNGSFGLFNQALASLGFEPISWLTRDPWRQISIVLIDVWMWTPFMMLIALAGLNAIPQSLYEAAEIDRAGRWTVFRRITLPMCAPLLGLAVLLRLTDAIKQFDLVMAIAGRSNRSTQTLSVMIYQDIVHGSKLGMGSAFSIVVLVIVVALATLFTSYLARMNASQGRAA
jgi:multiple sugar transport system permease protein